MHWARPLLTDSGEHSSGVVKCTGKFPLSASLMGLRLQYYRLHHPEVVIRYVIFLDYHFFKFCNHRTHGYSHTSTDDKDCFILDVTLRQWAVGIWRFERKCCQRNIGIWLPINAASYPRREESSSTPLRKPQNLYKLHLKMKQQFPPILETGLLCMGAQLGLSI